MINTITITLGTLNLSLNSLQSNNSISSQKTSVDNRENRNNTINIEIPKLSEKPYNEFYSDSMNNIRKLKKTTHKIVENMSEVLARSKIIKISELDRELMDSNEIIQYREIESKEIIIQTEENLGTNNDIDQQNDERAILKNSNSSNNQENHPEVQRNDLSIENIQEIRSEQIESEEMKSEEMKSEEMKSEEIRSEEMKSEEIKSEAMKSEQIKSEPMQCEKNEENDIESSLNNFCRNLENHNENKITLRRIQNRINQIENYKKSHKVIILNKEILDHKLKIYSLGEIQQYDNLHKFLKFFHPFYETVDIKNLMKIGVCIIIPLAIFIIILITSLAPR